VQVLACKGWPDPEGSLDWFEDWLEAAEEWRGAYPQRDIVDALWEREDDG
jgi:hypothetical protein